LLYKKYPKLKIIRYAGGKDRVLKYIFPYLPPRDSIKGRFVEPFVGSAAVFFALNPKSAILSDISKDLIDLYRGIKKHPIEVWKLFENFPSTKEGYYAIRSMELEEKDLAFKAARTLYLNRTCFKGMWRYNANGDFTVGYGGQDRRWNINEESLIDVSKRLRSVTLKCSDFEEIIDLCDKDDFIFLDPPYSPGKTEPTWLHYTHNKFTYDDHERLAEALRRASLRGVKWTMTTSSHPDILRLFTEFNIHSLSMGTSSKVGVLTSTVGEVLIHNYSKI
jgi:DNA adenine methylase